MKKALQFLKTNALALAFSILFAVFLTLWLGSISKLKLATNEAKASKREINELKKEILEAQKEFQALKNQIEENEKNRPTSAGNADATLDELLRKMQNRFNDQQARGMLDTTRQQ